MKSILTLLFAVTIGLSHAQPYNLLTGSISEQKTTGGTTPLPGATLRWEKTEKGTFSDSAGHFRINLPDSLPAKLIISFVGYTTDTVIISQSGNWDIILKPFISLGGVDIVGKRDAVEISTIKTIGTEQIGQKELLKAACCNLSESFETSASVNVSYSDAVTGAKEIKLLGLSGIYSQIMTENIPNMRGLASPFGLMYIPGPWMESIQITKGSGSVANGYESTTGQINIEYLKPASAPAFYVNGYAAESGNTEINVISSKSFSEKTGGMVAFHAENMPLKQDHNHDGFLDMPLNSNINLLTRLSYHSGKKFEGQFMIKALSEIRRAGQMDYEWEKKFNSSNGYGIRISTNRIEAASKTGLVFPEKPWRSAGLILSGSYHQQQSYFGIKTYDATQGSFYGSFIWMSIIGTTNHKWKAGIDYRADYMEEFYLSYPYYKEEYIPGGYLEYTYNRKEKLGLVAGIRADHHNQWGWFATPRLHMKYNFNENLIIRGSAGRSFRTANIFADNLSLFASSKDFKVFEELRPELAWNYGMNITWKFRAFWRPGSFSADCYFTDFTNQIIVDTYTSSHTVKFYNLEGSSVSRSIQLVLNYEAFKRFDVRLAYKNDKVFSDYKGMSLRKPLVPQSRTLINLAYTSRTESWRYDLTVQYNGETPLMSTDSLHHIGSTTEHNQVNRNGMATDFIVINCQISRKFKKRWETYIGCENLTGFTQHLPVTGADNPFGTEFDATNVWGPVMGRKIYAGFRYSIEKPKLKTN